MPEVRSLDSRQESSPLDLEYWLEPFEAAWRRGLVPSLDAFLPPVQDHARREVLEELIKIDLEYRWSHARQPPADQVDTPVAGADSTRLPRRPRLEDYVERFAELGPWEALPLELIGEEYRVRQQWGDRPDHAEYAARFPGHRDLEEMLIAIDRELAAEPAGAGSLPHAGRSPRSRRHLRPGVGTDSGPPTKVTAASLSLVETVPAAWPAVAGYEILGELGRGGMGVVYKARHLTLNRLVALKMILAGAHAGVEQLARFRAEAESQARLQHPHIVQIYDIGDSGSGPYFALELVDGGSLAQQLGGTPQPARTAAELVETLARAVQVAHERGLVHRDLKPANILLQNILTAEDAEERRGNTVAAFPLRSSASSAVKYFLPKISDFGLAKRLEGAAGQTTSGAIVGTPAYMAPEQAAGQSKRIGPAADVYALGVILYELLTGRPPFLAETTLDTLLQVRHQEPVSPRRLQPKVPRDLETICLKCLQKEPSQRYATAELLAQDLRRWLQGEPIQARPTRIGVRAVKWARRWPALAALLAVCGVSVVALLAVILVYDAQLRQKNADLEAALAIRTQARDALDLLSSEFLGELLARQKELSPEHRQFLEKAVTSYETLARDTGQEEASRFGVARAYVRVGNIRERLGQRAEAKAAYLRAGELYQQLADEFPTVPQYRQGLSTSYMNLGTLLHNTGQTQDAEQALRVALKLQQQLAADFPTVPEYRADVAGSHGNLGKLLRETGRAREAEHAYRDALVLWQQLAADFSRVPKYRRYLAGTHTSLGILLADTGRVHDAVSAFRDALKWQQQLLADFPTVPDYRSELAKSYNNLANLLTDTGELLALPVVGASTVGLLISPLRQGPFLLAPALISGRVYLLEAEQAHQRCLQLCQQLVAEFPGVPEYRRMLAQSYSNLGDLLASIDRAQDAERAYRDALKVHQQLAVASPTVADYQHELAHAMVNLADLLRRGKKASLARQQLEQAVTHHQAALKANPRNPYYRESFRDNRKVLTETLIDLGEHLAAVDTAAQLVQAAVDPANDVYNAACLLSRCVPLAEHDAQLPEAKRKELAQGYADRAIATLRQAMQNGYKDGAHMSKDTDLDPLRSRQDFKQLLADVATNRPH